MEQQQKLTPAQEVDRLRKELANAEAVLIQQRENDLKGLPTKLGFASMTELVHALVPLTNGEVKLAKKKRNTKKVDEDKKKLIIADLKTRKMTGQAIADKYNLSLPTIQGIKKAAGLVKKD